MRAPRKPARSNRMAERFETAAPHPGDDWYAIVSMPRPGSATLGKAMKLAGSVIVALIALNLYAPASPTILERVLASAILASLAHPVCVLSRYSVERFKPPVPAQYIELALEYSLLGLYSLFAGYYGPAKWLFAPILPRFNLQWRNL